MPNNYPHTSSKGKTLKGATPLADSTPVKLDPALASIAIIEGLQYLKDRLQWSGTKIAGILHLPANTVNTWLKNGSVPIHSSVLHPDIQALVHLLAIHRSVEAMFDNPEHQQAWLSTPHPMLNGTPVDIMGESIEGLIFIRQYLDYTRGRGA